MTRPARRMPSLATVEDHWGVAHGQCLRCGQPARCERAHLIDRVFDGLDGPQNIVPLCYPCHKEQPSFASGEEARALAWLATPDDYEWYHLLADTAVAQFPDLFVAMKSGGMTAEQFVDATFPLLEFDMAAAS